MVAVSFDQLRYHFSVMEFEQMPRYLDTVARSLTKHKERFEQELKDQAQGLTEEEREQFYEFHYDEYTFTFR